jgi:hypothetical protein
MECLYRELNAAKGQNILLDLDTGAIEGLKKMPVDLFDGVYLENDLKNSLVLCVDVRNFSSFLCLHATNTVFKLIREFTTNLLSCINQCGYGCSYYKLVGDGAIIIWDETSKAAINEALAIFDLYTDFLNEDLFKPYKGLGLGGALVEEEIFKYEISAEVSQLKYRDYVGYAINLACRLQTLAHANELILNERLGKTFEIPFNVKDSPEILKGLHDLKGLKEEDRKRLLFYYRRYDMN